MCLTLSLVTNGGNLTSDPKSRTLPAAFCPDSDLVTIYPGLQELLTVPDMDDMMKGIGTAGSQASYMPEIRDRLAQVATVQIPAGSPNVLGLVGEVDAWDRSQPGAVIGTSDRLLECATGLKAIRVNQRKAKFERGVGAGGEFHTTLVYQST
jgi:hypothetical protein